MAKSQPQTATFMMLCIGDFSSKLWLPAKFVRKHTEITHQISAVLETASEKCWDVKIKRINGDFFIKDGWPEFVKDNELTALDFLTFRLLHGSTNFKVSIYGADGCTKHPASPTSDGEEMLHETKARDENVTKRRRGRPFKFDAYDGGDGEEMLHETKARDENVTKRRVIPIKRGRGRPFKYDAYGTSVSINRRQSKAHNDVVFLGSSSPTNSLDSSQDSNPLYLKICLKRHQRSRITIPVAFWKAGGLMERNHVIMEFAATRRCKSVALDRRGLQRIDLTTGWSEFRKANGIVIGKTYSFEYNPNMNVIRVKEVKDGS